MTEEEYLEYDRTHDGKREFVNGELIDMAGASEAHSLIVANLHIALASRLRGRPCRAYIADMRVRIDETGLYAYPDLTVVCGKAEFAPTRAPKRRWRGRCRRFWRCRRAEGRTATCREPYSPNFSIYRKIVRGSTSSSRAVCALFQAFWSRACRM